MNKDIIKKYNVPAKYIELLEPLDKITDAEREDFISYFRLFYCLGCGLKLGTTPFDSYCSCQNDE